MVVVENITTVTDLLLYANQLSDGIFGWLLLCLVFFVGFFSLKEFDTARAFAASSFITSLIALFLNWMGILSTIWLVVTIIVCIISVVWVILTTHGE